MFKLIVALCASSAVAFQSAMPAARATSSLKAVEEFEIGVQPPAGFFDPLNYCEDQPESFVRRRAVERKHGRVTMVAFVGILVHNANIEFPGYLSKSQGLKFSDIPNGIYGLSKVPSAGLLQILLFFGLVELAWWPASNYSGDYGVGFFGAKYEGEEKLQKLNAEMANGRLAMLGVAGAMLAEGQTGGRPPPRAQLQPLRLSGDGGAAGARGGGAAATARRPRRARRRRRARGGAAA
ncbi:chlorophyll A-B binding protein [Aureococcus anophagefferens]|uniref:Chlorophyll A-B binding protein n=1 Tax=Aureococcus anophagefferens TaxID=44056 RepID=A0ABR1GC48_AURAN